MSSPVALLNKVHITRGESDLTSVKAEITALSLDMNDVSERSFAFNHLAREFNKRCSLEGLTGLMFSNTDSGFRSIV